MQSSQVQKGESKNFVLVRAETAPRTVKEQNPQKDKERVGDEIGLCWEMKGEGAERP